MAIQDFTTNRRRNQARENWSARTNPLDQEPAPIKVVGVGNAGCKRVERMMRRAVPGMTFAMVNTKANGTETGEAGVDVIRIGANNTRAWGAPGNHQTGIGGPDDSPDETSQELRQSLADADLVFVTAGMGGGTGTSAASNVARLAKEQGAFVVGLVTAPFSFEGRRRMGLAVAGIERLRPQVDNLILVQNDRLLGYIDHSSHMASAFQKVDEVVAQAMIDLSEVINAPQEVNLEFAGVRYIMGLRGGTLMAIGRGSGTAGPAEAARQALANPLLDLSFDDASGVLMMFNGGSTAMTLGGVNAARQVLKGTVRDHSHVFIGVRIDEGMGEEVSLTLIAAGLQQHAPDVREKAVITKERHP